MKSGNLNFLEPSGPLQACNGTALHFTVKLIPVVMFLFSDKTGNVRINVTLRLVLATIVAVEKQ
jgi:hypothetical protein